MNEKELSTDFELFLLFEDKDDVITHFTPSLLCYPCYDV